MNLLTQREIEAIEIELGLVLPHLYRKLLAPCFPFGCHNVDQDLWIMDAARQRPIRSTKNFLKEKRP